MWQVLLAAAIAGSGYFAKHLLHKPNDESTNHSPQNLNLPIEIAPSQSENPDPEPWNFHKETSSIFRFSSASSGSKSSRKKLGRGGGIKGNHERKLASEKIISGLLVEDQRKNVKKFAVCLKKRRTSRNASAKCDSSDVKDKSSFGWGVGVGIMYMMSAGKAEISRLNTAVDETAKIVQELKSEISKRKSSRDLTSEKTSNQIRSDIRWGQAVLEKSNMQNNDIENGDYASSILTEEPHQEVLEMDDLEAELESELLKLHGCTIEASSSFQNKVSTQDLSKPHDLDLGFDQRNGVMPYELDKRLCHLQIEQQESQIMELESELERTNLKLSVKESELQALKDCVKRLTEFSLACPSDEEREGQVDDKMINGNGRSTVGIKRPMDFN